MPIDPLPSISRSDANFRTRVDDYFLTRLPAFSTQAESARVQIVAAESTTTSAASTAATAATTATTAAGTATSASASAVTAKNAAEAAAANAISTPVAAPIHAAPSKAAPVGADELGLSDSAASWGLKKLTFANLKTWIGSFFVSKAGDTMTGGLSLPTNGLSVGTNQLVVTDGNVGIGAGVPAGRLHVTDSAADLAMIFRSGGLDFVNAANNVFNAVTFQATAFNFLSGNVLLSGGALGYGIGSCGTVTQATSKSTAVTLNKSSGQITMNNEALAAGAEVQFLVGNGLVSSADVAFAGLDVNRSNSNHYDVRVVGCLSGAVVIAVKNISPTPLSAPIYINFAVFKVSTL